MKQICSIGSSKTENIGLFFNLYNFDSSLFDEQSVQEKLQQPLRNVRESALQIYASTVTDSIRAILIVPKISGIDGIKDAFQGLKLILASASEKKSSEGLAHAYEILLTLILKDEEVRNVLKTQSDWYTSELNSVFEKVIALWSVVAQKPLVLAPFSIPSATQPNNVIIHNWTFVSFSFAKLIGREGEMTEALEMAAKNSEIKSAIRRGQATKSVDEPNTLLDLERIRTANQKGFYSIVGQYLVLLQRSSEKEEEELCKVLIEQCLRFGPREIDATILFKAAELGLHEFVQSLNLQAYIQRMRDNVSLRSSLRPIARLFEIEKY